MTEIFMTNAVKLKYPDLSDTFFRGGLIGQIRSVFKTRFDRPGKVRDFKKAIEAGDVVLDIAKIPRPERVKLAAMDIDIPPSEPKASANEPSDDTRDPAGELSGTAME